NTSPLRALVQGAGESLRIGRVAFLAELDRSVALRRILNLYLHTLMTQLATSASCLRYHEVGPRLARWLLMSHDRAHSDHFLMTHEFLSTMLGVRRVGITMAAGALQRAGLIEYQRGEITVLNRKGLQAMSCTCYEIDRQSYRDAMGRERK
ncbi:MAG: helix-turn-helix domain-containing protein, partial [Pseudomonadota bacterium]|nr:helix-turn-helix domain-containing protein [Pseudomonadota bacterium]